MVEATQQRDKLNVFISYSRDDLAFADQLDAALGLAGFGATIDRQGISAGEDWQTRLGALIRDSDTVVFVLSTSSARSKTCAWEVEEAVRLGKRILPVLCSSLEDASPPPQLAKLNYIYFYAEPRFPGSGFGVGLVGLVSALNTDLDWLREHTRYLQRATEWDAGGRPANRLLSGPDIALAKAWAARRPKNVPEPTELQLHFIKASETEAARQQSAEAQRLEEIAEAQAERGKALAEREEAQKREAEAREAEAESLKREAEQARRVAQRTRLGLAAVSIVALIAVISAIYAVGQRNRAAEQHDLAVARQLATEARVDLEQGGESAIRLQRSLLLATASLKLAWTQEGFEAWSKAVELLPPTTPVLEREEGPFGALAFSRDGNRVAVAGKDSIVVMDSASLKDGLAPKIVARLPQAGVTTLAFKPTDGEIVVGAGQAAIVWSLSGPQQVKELRPGDGIRFDSIAFDSQGKRLATAGMNYCARLFETVGWTETGRVGSEAALAVAFSPDDRWLLTAGPRVVAWDLASATRNPDPCSNSPPADPDSFVVVDQNAGSQYFLSFSGEGRWLVEGSGLRSVIPSDAGQKFRVAERLDFSSNPIVAVSSDAGLVATKAGPGEAAIWRGNLERKQFQELGRILASAVAFAPTGNWLIGAADDRLERWDLAAGAEWRRLLHGVGVLDVAVNPNTRFLATTTADGSAHVWETNTWREIFKVDIHRTEGGAAESNLAFSADGHWLAATSQNVVKLFSTEDWRQVASRDLENTIHSVVFSSDSKWLVVNADPELDLIAMNSWLISHFVHKGVDSVSISPDGRQLLISHKPYCQRAHQIAGLAQVWEISSGQRQGETPLTDNSCGGGEQQDEKPGGALQDTNWRDWKPIPMRVEARSEWTSPDGAWIVKHEFSSDSIELRASTAADRPGIGHRAGGVNSMAFSPDGKWFVTTSDDGVARIWTLDRATMIVEACARSTHDLSPDDWRAIMGGEPYSSVCPGLPTLQ